MITFVKICLCIGSVLSALNCYTISGIGYMIHRCECAWTKMGCAFTRLLHLSGKTVFLPIENGGNFFLKRAANGESVSCFLFKHSVA